MRQSLRLKSGLMSMGEGGGMRIGELAERSGLAPSRIRFYEASGLLSAVERGANGYRRYGPEALSTLEIITSAQTCGFTLEEIRPLLPMRHSEAWQRQELLAGLRRKLEEITLMQKRLARNRRRLMGVIASIENKPPDIPCKDNMQRVLAKIR